MLYKLILASLELGLALLILLVQVISLNSIRKMILETQDCKPNYREFYEHLYVFALFNIVFLVQSLGSTEETGNFADSW